VKKPRRRDGGRRSAANVSVNARRCPWCRCNDALRMESPGPDGSVIVWCRFCTFTETKGRNAL
jgi:hypothetical protein